MAGSEAEAIFSINSGMEDSTHTSEISAVIDKWQVQYARFINWSSVAIRSTHPSLTPTVHRLRGAWISTASASIKLIYERSSTGLDDAVLVLSLRSTVLEEHYVSKMRFSWPQVSCVSGFPARGSKAVFVSYKDGDGKMQKFALQFLTNYEAEKFMNLVKEILENGSPKLPQYLEFHSVISSQAETIFSHGPEFKPNMELEHTISEDNSTQVMHPSSEFNAAEYSISHEGIGDHEDAETMSGFPPSFTELMNSCNPAVSKAKLTEHGEDLKSQFVRYLEETSFKELLATVENVITELGDDMVL